MHTRHAPLPRAATLPALLVLVALIAHDLAPALQPTAVAPAHATATPSLDHLRLAFEPNRGQAPDSVQYLVRHGQATTYFDATGATTVTPDGAVSMRLDGADAAAFEGAGTLPGVANYFKGNDPAAWQTGIETFGRIVSRNVYPGIDLAFYGAGDTLEHDFIVAPGADYTRIAFSLEGQDTLTPDDRGGLILHTGGSELRLNAPVAYQGDDTAKHTVASRFEVTDNTVTVSLGEYDPTQAVVIDPTLVYSTYLGGSGTDFGRKVVVDSSGNAYVTGETSSADFPMIYFPSSPYQDAFAGGSKDAFVTKIDPSGTFAVYSTYLGGSDEDYALGIAVDSSGNAYVAGDTQSTDFPTVSPYQGTKAGTINDNFVAKLDADGENLLYATYMGGSEDNKVRMIAIDGSNNMYVAGYTSSTDFPTVNAWQSTNNGTYDAYLYELNAAGTALVYSTYMGGSDNQGGLGDSVYDLAVSPAGSAYVIGYTSSNDLPLNNAYQGAYGGGTSDAFVAKFNPGGSSNFLTYLGGDGEDVGRGIAIDSGGSIYLTGFTSSTDFPLESAFQPFFAGTHDVFVTAMDTDGTGLFYSTYLGGGGEDEGTGIGVTASGDAYVVGYTDSVDLPTILPYQNALSGSSDVLVAKVNDTGTVLYSTYFGGTGTDYALGVDIGPNSQPYFTGLTTSTDLPTSSLYQTFGGGGGDAFVAQLSDLSFVVTGSTQPTLSFSLGSATCSLGHFSPTQTMACTHTMSAASNADDGYVVSYIPTTTLTSSPYTIDAMASQAGSTVGSEQFGMNLVANTTAGSHTASDFGAGPSGGSGTVLSGYQTTDQFKFDVSGADIAATTAPSNPTVYTVSFIANIGYTTEAGAYSTPVTYAIVASY